LYPSPHLFQTESDVVIEIDVEKGTRGKEATVEIKPSHISCVVRGQEIFKGKPYDTVVKDESTWTIEDKKLIRIQLIKAHHKTKDLCWVSLLENQYYTDPVTLNEMRKKLDLENFQKENPGFDFSNAKLDKRYDDKEVKKMASASNQNII
jgi:hypothetical protein